MEIHWVGLGGVDDRERSRTEVRIEKLVHGHRDLIDLRITGRESPHHRHGEKQVTISCQARGAELVASRTRDELGLALHDALGAFEREVHRMREKRRDRSRGAHGRPAPVPAAEDGAEN